MVVLSHLTKYESEELSWAERARERNLLDLLSTRLYNLAVTPLDWEAIKGLLNNEIH